jgi:hypothetical protein
LCPFDHEYMPLDSMRLYCRRCGAGKTWAEVAPSKPRRSRALKRRNLGGDPIAEIAGNEHEPTVAELEAEAARAFLDAYPTDYDIVQNVPVDDPLDDSIGSGSQF